MHGEESYTRSVSKNKKTKKERKAVRIRALEKER